MGMQVSAIWLASSRVGLMTSMKGPRWFLLRCGSLSMQGSENAAVLPVPVFAAAITSRPSSANGMARS